MNQACMENCAIKRNTSAFILKDDVTLSTLPPFPQRAWQNEMNPAERQMIAGVYMAKVVDHLQGRENNVWTRATRPYINNSRNGRVSKTLQKQSIRDGTEGRDTDNQDREKCQDSDNGLEEMAGGELTAE